MLQFLLEGLATTFAGGIVGVALSYVLVWLVSPRPFLSELLDDASRSADIYLILSVELVGICTAILMVVGLISSFVPAVRHPEVPLDEDVLLCGGDEDAKQRVGAIAERIVTGKAVDCGGLRTARRLESLTGLLIAVNRRYKTNAGVRVTGLP